MTAVPNWQPGTLYQPGSLVVPSASTALTDGTLTNGNFEDGDTGWIHQLDAAHQWRIGNSSPFVPFQGSWCANFGQNISTTGTYQIVNTKIVACTPGQVINIKAMIANATGPTNAGAAVSIFFWDSSSSGGYGSPGAVQVGFYSGNVITGSTSYQLSSYTAVAPPGAAYAQFAINAYSNSYPCDIQADACSWDYAGITVPTGLVFQAVQTDAATSGTTEPTWPTVLGDTVTDGGVTWEAVQDTQVTWTASPILVSGDTEPTWSTDIGGTVADNTIGWTAISSQITDSKCPNTDVVAIAASKIFAGDNDIIPFSATVNPLDWSTANDAGYLPFGLQTYGAEPVSAIGLYRSNLVAFNASAFQMWQVDQDPANMALLDAVPVGCIYPRSLQPLANDLIFLSSVGFRNVGIAGASTNLQTNGVGQPIDALVKPLLNNPNVDPLSLFYPANGQYWGIFGSNVFVLTINGANNQSWSRYEFPSEITDWTVLDGDLILRSDTLVWKVSFDALWDDIVFPNVAFTVGVGTSVLNAADSGEGGIGYNQGTTGSLTPSTINGNEVFSLFGQVSGSTELYLSVEADLAKGGIAPFTIPDSDIGSVTLTPATASFYIPYDGFQTQWYFNGTQVLFTAGSTYHIEFSAFTGFDLASNTGAITGTTLSGKTILRAALNGSTFELRVSDVLPDNENTLFGQIELYNGSDPATSAEIAEFGIADATVTPVGTVTIGSTTYNNVVSYTWDCDASLFTDVADASFIIDGYTEPTQKVDFTGTVWWPHIDCGPMGVDKQLVGFDLISNAPTGVTVSIGYDQRDLNARTADYAIDADTLPGPVIPFPLTAPSFDVKLTFAAGQAWEHIAANLYLK